MNNRVGLLGGTFNPVHRGHVDLGQQIRDAFHLEKILYIISAQPPHKKDLYIAPAPLRWQMLTQALKPFPHLEPCDIEMKRPTWSWTIDTIIQLKEKHPNTDFFFLSGSEGFLKIQTWKEHRKLMDMISFIVVLRKPEHHEAVRQLLKEENRPAPHVWPENNGNIETLPLTEASIYLYTYRSDKLFMSSTIIRQRIKEGLSIDGFVDAEVKKILEENKLYES